MTSLIPVLADICMLTRPRRVGVTQNFCEVLCYTCLPWRPFGSQSTDWVAAADGDKSAAGAHVAEVVARHHVNVQVRTTPSKRRSICPCESLFVVTQRLLCPLGLELIFLILR